MYPKLIFMDLEGTLLQKSCHLDNGKVAPSAWTLLAENLGPEALREEELSKDRWLQNGYNGYIEWMQDTITIHQRYGLGKALFDKVMASVKEMPRVRETISSFKNNGAITAIVTGGFKALADRIQRSCKIDHSFAACEYFFNPETGHLEHWNLLPADYEGKVDFMKLIMKEHKFTKEECAFIGDGQNDVAMAKEVGLSIAFNAQPQLKQACTYVIDQLEGNEDFYAVAEYLNRRSMDRANNPDTRDK